MLIFMFLVFVGSSHIASCHGYNGHPSVRPSPNIDLYGELVARMQRLEQEHAALESKMAAMAEVIEEQQREIGTLKERVTADPTISNIAVKEGNGDKTRDDEHGRPNTDKPGGAKRHLSDHKSVRIIKKREAYGGKVAFFARADVGLMQHLGVNQNVRFEKVVVNIGNAYNPHHGVFTAPVSGTYLFSSSVMSYIDREVRAHIAVNGNSVARIFARGTGGRHEQGSQTIVLTLQQGDDVTVQNELNDDALYGSKFCSFSGVLLWQTFSESVIVG